MRRQGSSPTRIAVTVLACTCAFGAVTGAQALATTAAAPYGPVVPPGYTATTSAANRAKAAADAQYQLGVVQLPAGSVQLGGRPSGDHGYLRADGDYEASPVREMGYQWWTAPLSPNALMTFLRANAPTGSTQNEGLGAASSDGTTAQGLGFSFAPIKNQLLYREVQVIATKLVDGKTGVLVQSQSDWFVLRNLRERIPASVKQIQIRTGPARKSDGRIGAGTPISINVTGHAHIAAISKIVNAMPIVQPGTVECPRVPISGARTIRIRFMGAGGKPLAALSYVAHRPLLASSYVCNSVKLAVHGKLGHALTGGSFVRTIQRLLGKTIV